VGDAAHATAPNMAQGAAMAAEDALVLAEELGAHESLPAAVAAFGARRAARTTWVRTRARRRDRTRGLPTPVRDAALRLAGGASTGPPTARCFPSRSRVAQAPVGSWWPEPNRPTGQLTPVPLSGQ
jgi:2-polyprenyl-6-methoxyphenol hydroxylase-like FAD-dependent oxidoreductase